ncbi:MAG: serine/threonine protein kinase [Anaerolineae bacterium]|nr:serine/threonine protein kinase [Anaerolineae bacterium]
MSSTPNGIAGLLPERYHLLERLGSGGMATVYRAEDRNLRRFVAIKVLHEHLGYEASFRERFEQEARIVATFNHPNIIRIYDFATVENHDQRLYYMVMPFIPGTTLADVLDEHRREQRTLPAERIRRIMGDLAGALDYAHDRGMVHRDVKPGNIIFDEHGHAILTDFGIARLAQHSNLTQEGFIIGTPAYMSPEQASGLPLDGRTDIYSLGVILFEMLTGRPPYEDDGTLSLLLKHIQAPIPAVAPLLNHSRPQLDVVISRALAKKPEDRYRTARAFADDLEAVFAGKPLAEPEGVPPDTRELPPIPVDKPEPEPATLLVPAVPVPARPPTTRVLKTLTLLIQPTRQSPWLFLGLLVVLVLVLLLARSAQPSPGAAGVVDGTDTVDSMTGDFLFTTTFDAADDTATFWQQTGSATSSRRIADGRYILTNTEINRARTALFTPDYVYSNIQLTMQANLAGDSAPSSGYGIVFGYQDSMNYHVFAVDGVGRFGLWALRAGEWRELRDLDEDWTASPAVLSQPQPNTLTVNIFDGVVTGLVNGTSVVSLPVPDLRPGSIGIYMATPSRGQTTVAVDTYAARPSVPMTSVLIDPETDTGVKSMVGEGTDAMIDPPQ